MKLTSTLLFLLTALVGVYAAYDRQAALNRFIVIAIGLWMAAVLVWIGRTQRGKVALAYAAYGCLWLAGGVALFFLLTRNGASAGGSIPLLQVLVSLGEQATRKNATADALIILLPIGAGALAWFYFGQRAHRELVARPGLWAGVGLLPLAVGLAGLALSGSRGAWIGLGLGIGFVAYATWRLGRGRSTRWRWLADAAAAACILALAAAALYMIFAPGSLDLVRRLTQDASARSRVSLWHDMLPLARDYAFTGAGLGSLAMVYATYGLLLHVVFLSHAHELYLQLAVEQGLPGLIAFLWMVGTALWDYPATWRLRRRLDLLQAGAAVALVAMLVHGLFDAELYASPAAALTFLPIGFVWAISAADSRQAVEEAPSQRAGQRAWQWALALLPVLSVLALLLLPGAGAALQANLGAVSQTRAELSVYAWPQWPVQDALRRDPAIQLDTAIARYKAALVLDAGNVTANRRLGQIELDRGDFAGARSHLEAAYAAAPENRATRQLLGEAYAVLGDEDRAVALWRTVDTSQHQFDIRKAWYESLGDGALAQRIQVIAERAATGK